MTKALILTAVTVETESIHRLFDGWKRVFIPGDTQEYHETVFSAERGDFHLYTCQQQVMGMTAAASLATKAIGLFHPDYVLMTGIAAGTGDEALQMYGDVIVPDMIWDYSTGKFVGSDESEIRFGDIGFLPRPVSIHLAPELKNLVEQSMEDPENEYHVHLGPMACGSSVVANQEMVQRRVLNLFPRTAGLDMESYGILFAAENAPAPKPKAMVVKSICDFANSEKSDQFQKFAAYTSSGYLKYMLEKYLPVY